MNHKICGNCERFGINVDYDVEWCWEFNNARHYCDDACIVFQPKES